MMLYDTGRGIFKPGGYGGGIFDGNLSGITAVSGMGADTVGTGVDWKTAALIGVGVFAASGAVYLLLKGKST